MPSTRVLVLHRDRLYSELLRKSIQALFATARIVVACSIADASAALAQDPADVLVTSVIAADGEVLDALPDWVENRHLVRRTLMVTSRKEPFVLERLSKSKIHGVCDSGADLAEFERAFAAVAAGQEYWSATMRQAFATSRAIRTRLRSVTPTERLVFAVFGAGYDDNFASELLDMTPQTVASVRSDLHQKLDVHHRGELVQRAQQYGVVIIEAGQIFQPGFAALLAARERRRAARK